MMLSGWAPVEAVMPSLAAPRAAPNSLPPGRVSGTPSTVAISRARTRTVAEPPAVSGSLYYFGDPVVESTVTGTGRVVRVGG